LKRFEIDLNLFELEFESDLTAPPFTVVRGHPSLTPTLPCLSTNVRLCTTIGLVSAAHRSGRSPPPPSVAAWCPSPPAPSPGTPRLHLKGPPAPSPSEFIPLTSFLPQPDPRSTPSIPPLHRVQSQPLEMRHITGIARNAAATSASR
jgi:hypothetical protein